MSDDGRRYLVLGSAEEVRDWSAEHGLGPDRVVVVTYEWTGDLTTLLGPVEVVVLDSWFRAPAELSAEVADQWRIMRDRGIEVDGPLARQQVLRRLRTSGETRVVSARANDISLRMFDPERVAAAELAAALRERDEWKLKANSAAATLGYNRGATAEAGRQVAVLRAKLRAISSLCDKTIWILNAKDVRAILDAPSHGDRATCGNTECARPIEYLDHPNEGGRWVHAEHPADGHDAVPASLDADPVTVPAATVAPHVCGVCAQPVFWGTSGRWLHNTPPADDHAPDGVGDVGIAEARRDE